MRPAREREPAGTGNTTLTHVPARYLPALRLRIDLIETVLKTCSLRNHRIDNAGYAAAMALARDVLAAGFEVIAGCVDPGKKFRSDWRKVALEDGHRRFLVEPTCTDVDEHRRRIETWVADLHELEVATRSDVECRECRLSETPDQRLDNAGVVSETLVRQTLAASETEA